MNIATRIDLQNIYENQIKPPELFNGLVQLLDSLETMYSGRAVMRTRNDQNKILSFASIKYFTFVDLSDMPRPPTIFAGALEQPPRGAQAPVIRVRNANSHLAQIPQPLSFPFGRERNPGWTNIVISSDTIDVLKILLPSEVEDYFTSLAR